MRFPPIRHFPTAPPSFRPPKPRPLKPTSTPTPAARNERGQLINNKGQAINAQGRLINDKNQLINEHGHRVDHSGRMINGEGRYVDKDSKLVNKEGFLIDKTGRPLDKEGQVARDKQRAVKGNNEPHESLLPATIKNGLSSWQDRLGKPRTDVVETPKVMSVAEATQRMIDADKMVKNGVIPKTPGAGLVTRDAAISAGITGVVSAPFNIASYSGSAAAGEAIKASYVPSPLIPPTPIAKSTVDRPETAEPGTSPVTQAPEDVTTKALYAEMDDTQGGVFAAANLSMALKFGDTDSGFIPGKSWSSDPLERMEQLEDLLDFAEEHTKDLAEGYEVFFKAYLPDDQAAEGKDGLATRLDTLKRRLESVEKAQKLVLEKTQTPAT